MKIVSILVLILFLTGCADYVTFEQAVSIEPVGFLHGLWHGMIFTIAFIVSLFSDGTSVYAIYNNGGWYDFGVILGMASFTSGSACACR